MTHELDQYLDYLDECEKDIVEEEFYRRADYEHDLHREEDLNDIRGEMGPINNEEPPPEPVGVRSNKWKN